MKRILDSLGLEAVNAGTWYGSESSEDTSADLIESMNPATGEVIASVRSTSTAEFERLMKMATDSYQTWRKIPAPIRGNAVRLIGNALRDNKDALGNLVSLENGKIKAEGDGEVQEMIDIGRPVAHAVRQYDALGATTASYVRAMALAGDHRHDHCIQFSGRCLGVELLHRGYLRQREHLETIIKCCVVWHRSAENRQ